MLTAREHNAGQSDLVHGSNGLSDYGERVVADLAIRDDVIGSDDVEIINFFPRNKFAYVNCAGAFEGNAFKFLLIKFEIAVLAELVALNNVLLGDFLTAFSIDLEVPYSMPSFFVDLVEADFLRVRCGGKKSNGTCDEGKAQEPFPVGTRGHTHTPQMKCYSNTRQLLAALFVPARRFVIRMFFPSWAGPPLGSDDP